MGFWTKLKNWAKGSKGKEEARAADFREKQQEKKPAKPKEEAKTGADISPEAVRKRKAHKKKRDNQRKMHRVKGCRPAYGRRRK